MEAFMQASDRYKVPVDYFIMFGISVLFIIIAFWLNTPQQIIDGYWKIHTSRSVLITDYIALAGIGAALVNSAILLVFNLILLIGTKREPNGKIIASLFLTIGFSLFGKICLIQYQLWQGYGYTAEYQERNFRKWLSLQWLVRQ